MQALRAAARRVAAIVVALLMGVGALASAQGTTGSIAGFVTDESKAGAAGRDRHGQDVETGQTRVLVTDTQGRYRAEELAPGKYSRDRRAVGVPHRRNTRTSTLSVGQAAVLNVQMQIGGVTERVVVTGDAALVRRGNRRSPAWSIRRRSASCRSTAATSAS